MRNIADKIIETVKERNIRITALAKEIGVSRETIYKLSDDSIKLSTIKKVAEFLEVPITYFIEDEPAKKSPKKKAKPTKALDKKAIELVQKKLSKKLTTIIKLELEKEFKLLKGQ